MGTTIAVAIIVALSTLAGTFIQQWWSNKRFEKELERQREIDSHWWKRKVRSSPLLKLRDELARMATKAAKVAKPGKNLSIPLQKTKEQEEEALKQAIDDWNSYISGDNFDVVVNMQADAEIIKLAKEIRNEYLDTYDNIVSGELRGKELSEARRAAEEKLAPKVTQAQSLINKRLEEL